MPVEIQVVLIPVELGYAQGKCRGPVETGEACAPVEPEPDLAAFRVARAIPNLVDRLCLRLRQAVLRRGIRRSANVRGGAEGAGPRIVNDSVGDAVRGIARLNSRGLSLRELGSSDRPARQILHRYLAPHLGGLEAGPVHGGCIGQDPFELVTELLGQQISLASSGRAAIPIVVSRGHSVIRLRKLFGPEHLLLDSVANEVLDELEVIGAIGIYSGLAIAAAVTCIGPGTDIAGIDRGVHVQVSGATAAAEPLCAPVPGAL